MGQYWKAIMSDKNGENVVTFGMPTYFPKLMEHAYYGNDYVEYVCMFLSQRQHSRICWLGDYAENEDFEELFTDKKFYPSFEIEDVWNDDLLPVVTNIQVDFKSINKFLINYDTKEFINLNKNFELAGNDKLKIHPLPLLTAVGNDKGFGDFHEKFATQGYENVGKWTWNLIGLKDSPPENFTEANYVFIEERS